jgi:putative peptide zinc metalloprotease protein
MYTKDTVVVVHPFTKQQEGADVIIGRVDTGTFLAVPPEAVEVLEHLTQGRSVGEVAEISQSELAELDEFLSYLETKGFVKPRIESSNDSAADVKPLIHAAPKPVPMRYHFANFPQSLARFIFSRPVMAGCFVVMAIATFVMIRDPTLRTGTRDLYFPDRRTLSWTLLISFSYCTLFAHELAHLVAARALGVNSRLGIGYRLWYLVAETDLTGLWSVPKRERYVPLVAGTIMDAVSASVLILVLLIQKWQWPTVSFFLVRLERAMIFTYMLRLLWQCFFFLRTDFYYLIANFFDCRNLLKDTETFLFNQLARVFPKIRRISQSAIPAAEFRVIRAYSLVWLGGRAAALTLLFAVTIPLLTRYIRNLAGAFRIGISADPSNFIDAFIVTCYFVVPFLIGLWLWIHGLVRKKRTA